MSGFDPDAYIAKKRGKPFDPDEYLASRAPAGDSFKEIDGVNVPLPRANEQQAFDDWLKRNEVHEPYHPDQHYDYLGAFHAGIDRDGESAHFPDTFKLPGHETFSNESQYATGDNENRAGSWQGDDFVPPAAIQARQQMPLAERARSAARKMQQLGGIQHLDRDEREALKAMLAKHDQSRQVGTGEAMLGLGLNAAGGEMGDEGMGVAKALGFDADKEAGRDWLRRAREQHPIAGPAAQVGGALLGGIASPAGRVSAMAQGALQGYGSSEGDWKDQLGSALGGAGLGYMANKFAPQAMRVGAEAFDEASKIPGAVMRGAGKTFQMPKALVDWFGGLGQPKPAPVASAPPNVATLEEQLADAAAANPAASEAVTKTAIRPEPPAGAMPVAAGAENYQPVPLKDVAEKGTIRARAPIARTAEDIAAEQADNAARMPTRRMDLKERDAQYEHMTGEPFHRPMTPDQQQAIFDEVNGASRARYGDNPGKSFDDIAGRPAPQDDMAALEKLRDAGQAREPWNAQPDAPYQTWMERNQSKTPTQQAAAKFDNANASMDWDNLDATLGGKTVRARSPMDPLAPNEAAADRAVGLGSARNRQGWDVDSRIADPRENERGFGAVDLMAAMTGVKAGQLAGKAGINLADKAGKAMQAAGEKWRPSAMAAKLADDDSMLSQLVTRGGRLGAVGQMLMQTKQKNGSDAAKAQAFVVAQQPWFREQFEQGTGEQPYQDQGPMLPTGSY